jgi:hypothetical protein
MSLLKSSGGQDQGLWLRYVIGGHLVTCDQPRFEEAKSSPMALETWSGQLPHPFICPHSLHATLQTSEARLQIELSWPYMGLASIVGAPDTDWQ